jgi:hypothetical protein
MDSEADESRYGELDYEGAMSDCHAAVDELAKCALRNDDGRAAWWLCANHPRRVNSYPPDARDQLAARASWHGEPPQGWKSWVSWLRRPEVAADHEICLKW